MLGLTEFCVASVQGCGKLGLAKVVDSFPTRLNAEIRQEFSRIPKFGNLSVITSMFAAVRVVLYENRISSATSSSIRKP